VSAVICCLVDGSCPSAQFLVDTLSRLSASVSLSHVASPHLETSLPNFAPAHSLERMNVSPWLDAAEMSVITLPYNKSDNDGGTAFRNSHSVFFGCSSPL